MDLRVGASGIHLPPELLDIIVGFLAEDRQSLLNARLACKALHACTTKKLISRPSQPSEILTKGTLEVDDKALAAIRPIKSSPNAVTVWTWLRLPCKAGASRSLDKEFEHLLRAPSEAPYGERKDARGGRVATCWARMREDPELVAVVMQFQNEEALHKYRSSGYATTLRDYLERIAPGSVQSSTSSRWLLRSPHRNEHQLSGWPLTEIRTIYFKASTTAEQRILIANSRTNQYRCNFTPLPAKCPGPTMFAYLPGLREHKGQLTIVGRFMLRWRNEDIRQRFVEGTEEGRFRDGEWVPEMVQFERELDAAGRVDQKVYFCDFESGPWRA